MAPGRHSADKMDEPFIAADGTEIPYLEMKAKQFLDCTTAVYGPSKTGKTVTIKAIMKLLHRHIEQVILVSPTEPQNQSYKGTVPSVLTHHRMWLPEENVENGKAEKKKGDDKTKGGLRFFEQIWARQQLAVSIYNKANRLEILKKLYQRVADKRSDRDLAKIDIFRGKQEGRIRKHYRGGEMEQRLTKMIEMIDSLRRAFYRKHITAEYERLQRGREGLSADERMSLDQFFFNPRLLLIFDDCAAEFTNRIVGSEVFRKLFFQGRWAMVSVLIACHTPNDLVPGLRKNTFNCLFTGPECANSYFTSVTNGFSRADRRNIPDLTAEVFGDEDHPHRKFAFVRDSHQRFYVYQVPYPKTFRFGCEALWRLEDEVAARGEMIDRSNEFYQAYCPSDEDEPKKKTSKGR